MDASTPIMVWLLYVALKVSDDNLSRGLVVVTFVVTLLGVVAEELF